jgi:carbonic anhydrase
MEKIMDKLFSGISRFQKDVFPQQQKLFSELANGQWPEALFITCSDSRIDPNLITQSEPGDLFICRNAGNIVPPHSPHTGGMTASIEYAVAVLNVKHIVICGHTDCGAMKGALNLDAIKHLPHVCEWLGHSKAAQQIVNDNYSELDGEERLQRMIELNVYVQMQNIRTHPWVASRLEAGQIALHGWVYDIPAGGFKAYNDETKAFEPMRMEEEIKSLRSKNSA